MIRGRDILVTLLVILLTAVLGTVGVAAYRWAETRHQDELAKTPPQSGVAVGTAVVELRPVAMRVEARGFLEPFEQVLVATEIPGRVERRMVEIADRVARNEPLFQIDRSLHRVAVDKALAETRRAASDLRQAEVNAERIERLKETDSANPLEVLDVETALTKAEAYVKEADAALAEARILLEKTAIVSPVNGVIAAIHAHQGEYAQVGQPLAEVIVVDRLKLRVQLSDREAVASSPGDPVTLQTTALPGEAFAGRILRIYPRAARDSRKFEAEIEVPNSDGQLRPGFYAEATLMPQNRPQGKTPHVREILTIPRLAVMERHRQQYCYVIRQRTGEALYRAIWTPIESRSLLTDPKLVEVVAGLEAGDRVITTGLQHVTHESIVRVDE
jgi:membrane fusion protein (multidrug efflux system)